MNNNPIITFIILSMLEKKTIEIVSYAAGWAATCGSWATGGTGHFISLYSDQSWLIK